LYDSGTSPSPSNAPVSGTNAQTSSTGQVTQNGPSVSTKLQPPSNNLLQNANTNVRNMLNQPSIQNPRPNNLNLNQSTHSNNLLYNARTNVRNNMMNQSNLQSVKPENLNTNQSLQFRPPASTMSSSSTYSRTPQQSAFQQKAPPLYVNRGPIAKNEAPAVIFPISRLNPFQGRWTIKARVCSKGDLRTYNNTKGDGKLFSFDLIDSEGDQIRVTCFNSVAEQFYPKIEFGKVYLISKGSIKQSNKKFNPLNHEYEMNLDSGSIVEACEDDSTIPGLTFNFRQISDIESLPSETILDVIGVVTSISPASIVLKKNGTETVKRTLQLKDMSGRIVELSLWGNFVNSEGQQLQSMCDSGEFPILAIKGGRVNDFNGKSLSSIPGSQLFVEPDCVEAQLLRDWFNREGKSGSAVSISFQTGVHAGRADSRKTASQIKDEGLGHGEKPDWITVKGTITYITVDNFCYTACPSTIGGKQCNKKVTNNGDGTWRCDKCDQNFQECDYR
jgi:replication factor A1